MKSGPLIVLTLLAGSAASALAQGGHGHHPAHPLSAAESPVIEAFIAQARSATARYHDRSAAISDGFRRLGPDFPAMGEHWVNPGRMVDGTLDAARPQALSYAVVDGRPVLTGVIYARPLGPNEPAPDFPVPGYPWHDHVGAIDEESVLLHHVPSTGDTSSPIRLAMLHAWIWTDNPDGVFAPDNWSLPFKRLHLAAPAHVEAGAARALSLLSGGDAYYRLLFRALAQPNSQQGEFAFARIERARERVQQWFELREGAEMYVDDDSLARLSMVWRELWLEIGAQLDTAAAERLHVLLTP